MTLVVGAFAGVAFANEVAPSQPIVGEVRMFAVPSEGLNTISRLHQEGWVEARGELLSTAAFPELYRTIGRDWTSDRVEDRWFAVPQIGDRLEQRLSSEDPYGVLGPGDLGSGGHRTKAWIRPSPISYWIFAGRAVSAANAKGHTP